MNFGDALNWLKLSPKYLFAIAFAIGLILFSSEKVIGILGIAEIRVQYKSWLGIGFILTVSLLVVNFILGISSWAKTKITRFKNLSKLQEYLRHLTSEEILILRDYVYKKTKTQNLPIENGVVQGLVNNKVIYRSANMGNLISGWAFNIQPWAWEYLNKNLHLLSSEE